MEHGAEIIKLDRFEGSVIPAETLNLFIELGL